ncbi:hypothetical protein CRG98_015348 [Punica granatum]|uniref:Uncharacterized protein n=1 Tax=Punica granatum TaxID=22663 RepID=A0A2I0K6R0_PUNGR|nr:hypothetical protein CRG98_015348 [Punica granatum]
MRGMSRGSVRESSDSVERLEGCLGARAYTFGELGAQGRPGRHAGHTGGALKLASVRAGASSARACCCACGDGCTVHPRARLSPEIT